MQAHQDSLTRIEGYLATDPGNRLLLAEALDLTLALHDGRRLAAYADAALAHHPDDPHLLARVGNAWLALGRWEDAAQLFGRLAGGGTEAALLHGLAYARYRQGQFDAAAAALAPLAGRSDLPDATVQLLVELAHRRGDLAQALAMVAQQRLQGCQHAGILGTGSLAALDNEDFALAATLSEQALRQGPQLAALVAAGSLALARMDMAEGERLFQAALALAPEEGRAWSGLGLCSLLRRELGLARSQLARALELMPEHIGSWHLLGWCAVLAGDAAAAEQAFAQAVALDRNFGESHGGLAVAQAIAGDAAAARLSAQRALGLDPGSLSARYAEMLLAGETADPERFQALARRQLTRRSTPSGQTLAQLVDSYAGR